MCMFLAHPKNKRVYPRKTAYKVFVFVRFLTRAEATLNFPHAYHEGSSEVPTNKWLTTKLPGFHVFLTKAGAEQYKKSMSWGTTKVIRVKIRGKVLGVGFYDGYEGMRVSGLYVPRKKGKS